MYVQRLDKMKIAYKNNGLNQQISKFLFMLEITVKY